MRSVICVFTYLIISIHPIFATNVDSKDSLLNLLNATLPSTEKISIYRNLADLCFETPEEITYLKQLYLEAERARSKEDMIDALGHLSFAYVKINQNDSAQCYIDVIQHAAHASNTEQWLTFLEMRLFNQKISQRGSDQTIGKELTNLKTKEKEDNDIYAKISIAYKVGVSLFTYEKIKEAIPYLKTAAELSLQIPLKEGYRLQTSTLRLLANAYSEMRELQKSISLIEQIIQIDTDYYNRYCRENRPFYNLNTFLIQDYASLMVNVSGMPPEKAEYYLQELFDLCHNSTSMSDKYACFLSVNNYYLHLKDYKQAIIANDSLIKYAYLIAPYNVSYLYGINSQCYEKLGMYKEAFECLKLVGTMKDSLDLKQGHEQLNELQVKYDVDKLTYEKTQLEVRNKKIIVICLSVLLCIVVIVCAYLSYGLKKERRMKNKLNILKNKAEESENMKTVFINSICHEIRTPLNAIVGFSDLIFVEGIDDEMKKTFPEEIQKNTVLLTTLINSLLEIAHLDVSDEKLPCESADINHLFHQEMDRFNRVAKPDIHYHLEIPEETIWVSTNVRYLALVLENLLDNANKFTESGDITLRYDIDRERETLLVTITDTGCGVPVKDQERVFERFTKLDAFQPGNGLGLYLCRIIIRRLSGEIRIDPTYIGGTRVLISLPI